jgi:hypothetical protein
MQSKFKKFEPLSPAATICVEDLLKRGGQLVKETREQVEIVRQQSVATIDQCGRVQWRPR